MSCAAAISSLWRWMSTHSPHSRARSLLFFSFQIKLEAVRGKNSPDRSPD
jgi:hypothetical protein